MRSRPSLSRRHPSADDGQTLPLVALLLGMAAGLALLVGMLGTAIVDRTHAKNAADAAALAGAIEGDDGARRVAAANGAAVERFVRLQGSAVEVTVRVGRARATSRAEPTYRTEPR